MNDKQLIEELTNPERQRWAHWMEKQMNKWSPLKTNGYWMVVQDDFDEFGVLWRDWSGFGNDYENMRIGNAYRTKGDASKALSRVKKALKNHPNP